MKALISKGYSIVGITTYEWNHESTGARFRQLRKEYTLQKGDSVYECHERNYLVYIGNDVFCAELISNHKE